MSDRARVIVRFPGFYYTRLGDMAVMGIRFLGVTYARVGRCWSLSALRFSTSRNA